MEQQRAAGLAERQIPKLIKDHEGHAHQRPRDPAGLSLALFALQLEVTDCGALLYSRHNDHAGFAVDDDGSETAARAKAKSQGSDKTANVQEHFVLNDSVTGKECTGLEYSLKVTDGRVIKGETDGQGRTNVMWTDSPDHTDILPHPQPSKSDDPYHFPASFPKDN